MTIRIRGRALLVAVAVVQTTAPMHTLSAQVLAPNAVVRVRTLDRQTMTGSVVSVMADTLTVRASDSTHRIHSSLIGSVDVYDAAARSNGAVTGGLWGLGLGILGGGVIGFLAERGHCDDCGTAVLVVGAAGGVLGLVSGAILGAKYVDTRWRRVSYPARDPAP